MFRGERYLLRVGYIEVRKETEPDRRSICWLPTYALTVLSGIRCAAGHHETPNLSQQDLEICIDKDKENIKRAIVNKDLVLAYSKESENENVDSSSQRDAEHPELGDKRAEVLSIWL